MIRHEIKNGDHVKTDDGRSGIVRALVTKQSNPPKHVALIQPDDAPDSELDRRFEHPVDSLARVHPPHSLDWSNDELAQLWIDTPAERGKIKAVTYARRILAGRPGAAPEEADRCRICNLTATECGTSAVWPSPDLCPHCNTPDGCPECGSDSHKIEQEAGERGAHYVRCKDCGHIGPGRDNEPAAIVAWNGE